MEKVKFYDKFPVWMVPIANLVPILTYIIGAYIIFKFGIVFGLLYLAYCAFVEFNVLRRSCVNCYYYGKRCGFGRGSLCKLFFKKGNPKNFLNKKVSMLDLLPDFLTFIIPIVFGIVSLIIRFNWVILVLILSLLLISFAGNYIVRGFIACKYCKQRQIGCPANKVFNKKK
jgi:hypothetical protein